MRRLARTLLGWAVLGSGVLLLAVLTGQLVLADHHTAQAQARLVEEVPDPVVATGGPGRATPRASGADDGDALAVMTIPRFGADWRWVALEGTSADVLADGPGHYPQTPLPGERGNSAFAAHRAGHGDPFIDFDLLRAGDRVVLQQGGARWTYELDDDPEVIPVTADWVLAPTATPTLTLTTCWPRYGSSKRMFVRGHLVASTLEPGRG